MRAYEKSMGHLLKSIEIVDFDGNASKSIEIHGNLCKPLEIYENLEKSMKIYENR